MTNFKEIKIMWEKLPSAKEPPWNGVLALVLSLKLPLWSVLQSSLGSVVKADSHGIHRTKAQRSGF